jgi:hypothetical protein
LLASELITAAASVAREMPATRAALLALRVFARDWSCSRRLTLVRLKRLEMGNVTGDLFTTTGLAATAKARRRMGNKVVGSMVVTRMWPSASAFSLIYHFLR